MPLHCGGLLDGLIRALVPGWKGQGLCPVQVIQVVSYTGCVFGLNVLPFNSHE